jgi:hypothetical protein
VTVKELMLRLAACDPDTEVHYPSPGFNDSVEIHDLYESTATYGVCLPQPTTAKTVVLCTGLEGL